MRRGDEVDTLEAQVAERTGVRHAVAMPQARVGIYFVVKALIEERRAANPSCRVHKVILSPYTIADVVNMVICAGGTPVFADIERETCNIDAGEVKRLIDQETALVLVTHFYGLICDVDAISAVCDEHDVPMVEDAAQAFGTALRGRPAGSFGLASVFSFGMYKNITTFFGGMVLTDDEDLAAVMRSVHNQGRVPGGGWLSHERLGYNYRMSDIQAALGLAQLSRIDEILPKRTQVARWYDERLSDCNWLRGQAIPDGATKSWFVYVVELDASFGRRERDAILAGLKEKEIGCSNYFSPIHLQPFIEERLGTREGDYPVTERVADRTIALPFFSNLKENEIDEVCAALHETAAAARKQHASDR